MSKFSDIKKAHIAVSLILLVAETGIEPVTRGFSTNAGAIFLIKSMIYFYCVIKCVVIEVFYRYLNDGDALRVGS